MTPTFALKYSALSPSCLSTIPNLTHTYALFLPVTFPPADSPSPNPKYNATTPATVRNTFTQTPMPIAGV